MQYVTVFLFFLAGQPDPDIQLVLTPTTKAQCESQIQGKSHEMWRKSAVGTRDDGQQVIRAEAKCVPVDPADIDLLKRSFK